MSEPITVSAVVLRDEAGRVLFVRKRGTSMFMQPGGKPEPGETPQQTAIRECAEELGVSLRPESLRWLGNFVSSAANEAGRRVVANVYSHPAVHDVSPAAEIEELRWVDPEEPPGEDLAPLYLEHLLPWLRSTPERAGEPASNRENSSSRAGFGE